MKTTVLSLLLIVSLCAWSQEAKSDQTGKAKSSAPEKASMKAGGNATVGTISASGVYRAPSSVPSPSVVTVTATSVADPTKSASASVTVRKK